VKTKGLPKIRAAREATKEKKAQEERRQRKTYGVFLELSIDWNMTPNRRAKKGEKRISRPNSAADTVRKRRTLDDSWLEVPEKATSAQLETSHFQRLRNNRSVRGYNRFPKRRE